MPNHAIHSQSIYSLEEAALLLRVSRRSLYNHIADGKLKSIKIGARRVFRSQDLESFLNACAEAA